jgi:hypothetical protein
MAEAGPGMFKCAFCRQLVPTYYAGGVWRWTSHQVVIDTVTLGPMAVDSCYGSLKPAVTLEKKDG